MTERRTLSLFGAWLTAQLRQRGWSAREFAQHAGIHPRNVERWLCGTCARPRSAMIARIAAALDLSVDEVRAVVPGALPRCPVCGETDPSRFHRNSRALSGYQTYCRKCTRVLYGRPRTGTGRRVRIQPGFLRCARCKRDLDESAFREIKKGSGQRSSYCRACEKVKVAEWTMRRLADPERERRYRDAQRAYARRRNANLRRQRAMQRNERREAARRGIAELLAAGWTQREIAEALGTGVAAVSEWRHGKRVPQEGTLLRINRLVAAARQRRERVPEAA